MEIIIILQTNVAVIVIVTAIVINHVTVIATAIQLTILVVEIRMLATPEMQLVANSMTDV